MESLKILAAGRCLARLLAAATAVAMLVPAAAQAGGRVELDFDPNNFNQPLVINNTYLPLVEGTIFTYRAEGREECEETVVEVTNQTRVVAGVTTRVVLDRSYVDEECDGNLALEEETYDWFAQDDMGNVWYLGEDSSDCENNVCTPNEGSWEAGVDGAVAGIVMLADPQSGDFYHQEFYEGVAEDEAKVLRTRAWISLYREDAYGGDFHNCIVTKEWTRLSPGEIENKYYCPDIGLVAIDELMGGTLRFELVDVQEP